MEYVVCIWVCEAVSELSSWCFEWMDVIIYTGVLKCAQMQVQLACTHILSAVSGLSFDHMNQSVLVHQ